MKTLFRALRRFLLGDVCGRLILIIIMICLITLTAKLTKPIPVIAVKGYLNVNVDGGSLDVNVDTIEGHRSCNYTIPVTIER